MVTVGTSFHHLTNKAISYLKSFTKRQQIYYRKKDHGKLNRLRGLRTEFRQLFWTLCRLAQEFVFPYDGLICIEWPATCTYWKDPQVRDFICARQLSKTVLHGCAYGLKNRKKQFMKFSRGLLPAIQKR